MAERNLHLALEKLLKPLIRALIRYGVSHGEFADIAKRVYVDTAERDFPLAGRKQSISRVSMLTGISRKEVRRIGQLVLLAEGDVSTSYNRAVRIISGWNRDSDFADGESPMPLAVDGSDGSFTELVKRYSGDIPVRAVLDELLRVGAVFEDADGLIHLTVGAAYVPHQDKDAQFEIMGNCVADLLATLDHNFESAADDTRLQLTTAYDNLPSEAVHLFKQMSHDRCVALLREFDQWLSDHDRDSSADVEGEGRVRAGIGIYFFEEDIAEEDS
jgi:hypothetical protein|tara:strand:- start:1195 stop:2013 length:819 start_codon:yes stop_codon:yes gene_type:complete